MAKRKKQQRGEVRGVPIEDLRQGPIRHKEGLTPVMEEIARILFSKVGRFLYPSFEQWELGFMRDRHPWREIVIWENIARTYDLYMVAHPDADGQDVVSTIALVSTGQVSKNESEMEKELRELYREAYKNMWLPPPGKPFEFSAGMAPVLEYRDVVDEWDEAIHPNIRGAVDPRRVLADADIIVAQDTKSGQAFPIFGRDSVPEDGDVPNWLKTVVVRLDPDDEETQELAKMAFIVERIKGRHDLQSG